MKKPASCKHYALRYLPVLGALLLIGAANAQDAGSCPQLPVDSELAWEHRGTGDADFCRALRADGTEAFGMYISPKPSFEPKRGNSKETTQIGGQPVTWYSSEIAGSETLVARETLLPLRDGRTAHIWVQAPSQEALNATLGQTQNLRFGPASADTQVAGQ